MERLRLAGFVRRPTADEIRRLAATEYMNLNEREVEDLEVVIDHYLNLIDRLDDRSKVIGTFLAILELTKEQRLQIEQSDDRTEIRVELAG